jgi:hypothetical protein
MEIQIGKVIYYTSIEISVQEMDELIIVISPRVLDGRYTFHITYCTLTYHNNHFDWWYDFSQFSHCVELLSQQFD